MLKGYKTYLCAIGLGVVTALHTLGFITDQLTDTLIMFLGAGGLAALRAAVK